MLDVPYGQAVDHAEGMTVFSPDGGTARSLLVLYDAASKVRQSGKSPVAADLFSLTQISM